MNSSSDRFKCLVSHPLLPDFWIGNLLSNKYYFNRLSWVWPIIMYLIVCFRQRPNPSSFMKIPLSVNWVFPCGRADGWIDRQTDNFANASKIMRHGSSGKPLTSQRGPTSYYVSLHMVTMWGEVTMNQVFRSYFFLFLSLPFQQWLTHFSHLQLTLFSAVLNETLNFHFA
jgi:hypothetical protein